MMFDVIDELEAKGNQRGATIYNICHRNAGWAIQWHEKKKGLVVYRYYNTLDEMVKGELKRLAE